MAGMCVVAIMAALLNISSAHTVLRMGIFLDMCLMACRAWCNAGFIIVVGVVCVHNSSQECSTVVLALGGCAVFSIAQNCEGDVN
jgi:hypothetical protein